MNTHTERMEIQTLLDSHGKPAFVVLPIAVYEKLLTQARSERLRQEASIPHEVISLIVDGNSAARAWREHLGLTQAQLAERLGISQAALAQIEASKRPRKATREKLAAALGVAVEQLVTP